MCCNRVFSIIITRRRVARHVFFQVRILFDTQWLAFRNVRALQYRRPALPTLIPSPQVRCFAFCAKPLVVIDHNPSARTVPGTNPLTSVIYPSDPRNFNEPCSHNQTGNHKEQTNAKTTRRRQLLVSCLGVKTKLTTILISTPNGMVRSTALKRKAETRRWSQLS